MNISYPKAIAPEMAMLITPAMAREILDSRNNKNRRFRMWWAAALAAALARGEWVLTHQGIAFDACGRLIDGQHRLRAIVLANIPALMYVFVGLDAKAFTVIDAGIRRTTSDLTGLEKRCAEVCKRLAGLAFNVGHTAATAQQSLEVASAGVKELHGRLIEACPTNRKVLSAASVRAAAILLVMDGYPEDRVFGLYRNIVMKHYEDLPPAGLAFIRQADAGKIETTGSKTDLLARALKVLNPHNANITRIHISESDLASASAYARDVIQRVISVAAV